ncbi:Glutamine cyclotransferase [Filimonas lacunae]|uniref:Glutamine cyclotransferase n=1 Tax=Filimonas lacunae TaxID=477680 RepID=A0A173MAX4_9BACT|nr:glutaminyl-peptide cyclotransferase [Filimonas lacunae]BAV04618.1 glutamine cyclotransferase [Filimonas lacunae]SIT32632.1 Glutamine cyclotransferase [Filimonas lacunae]
MIKKYAWIGLSVLVFSCGNETEKGASDNENTTNTSNPAPAAMGYTVVKVFPHDTSSYTQGLIWHNNALYEGTGREGFSRLAKLNLESGKAEQQELIAKNEFGEGITILNNKIYQLTWQNHKVHVYDLATFKKIEEFTWDYEGWGITTDGKSLIISTGSSNLYFVDPATFKIIKTVGVTNNYGPVENLNELELVNGFVYANKYLTNYILKINPETGKVEAMLDLQDIFQKSGKTYDQGSIPDPDQDVLNGIAFNAATNTFYVTGKQWPALFEIKLN